MVAFNRNPWPQSPESALLLGETSIIARGNLSCDQRMTFGKKIRKMIETAEKYEAEREAAIEQFYRPQ
jgi:hypothetical protein